MTPERVSALLRKCGLGQRHELCVGSAFSTIDHQQKKDHFVSGCQLTYNPPHSQPSPGRVSFDDERQRLSVIPVPCFQESTEDHNTVSSSEAHSLHLQHPLLQHPELGMFSDLNSDSYPHGINLGYDSGWLLTTCPSPFAAQCCTEGCRPEEVMPKECDREDATLHRVSFFH
ncbi:hypothetical protein AOLI_G00243420 [Acnodon oligacanthus]